MVSVAILAMQYDARQEKGKKNKLSSISRTANACERVPVYEVWNYGCIFICLFVDSKRKATV